MRRFLSQLTRIEGNPLRGLRERLNAIQDAVMALANGENIRTTGDVSLSPGDGIISLGARRAGKTWGRGGTPPPEPCPFGEIISIPNSDPPARGIRGGVIHCGDSTWNMDPQELNLDAHGVWLVSLTIPVVVNQDDDDSILLPGIQTGTKPAGPWTRTAWSVGADYPDHTPPVVGSGSGTVIVPLGKLTITAPPAGSPPGTKGTPVFDRIRCGHITVSHCSGTLSYSRG